MHVSNHLFTYFTTLQEKVRMKLLDEDSSVSRTVAEGGAFVEAMSRALPAHEESPVGNTKNVSGKAVTPQTADAGGDGGPDHCKDDHDQEHGQHYRGDPGVREDVQHNMNKTKNVFHVTRSSKFQTEEDIVNAFSGDVLHLVFDDLALEISFAGGERQIRRRSFEDDSTCSKFLLDGEAGCVLFEDDDAPATTIPLPPPEMTKERSAICRNSTLSEDDEIYKPIVPAPAAPTSTRVEVEDKSTMRDAKAGSKQSFGKGEDVRGGAATANVYIIDGGRCSERDESRLVKRDSTRSNKEFLQLPRSIGGPRPLSPILKTTTASTPPVMFADSSTQTFANEEAAGGLTRDSSGRPTSSQSSMCMQSRTITTGVARSQVGASSSKNIASQQEQAQAASASRRRTGEVHQQLRHQNSGVTFASERDEQLLFRTGELPEPVRTFEDDAAQKLGKVVRGKLVRHSVERMRREMNLAAAKIAALWKKRLLTGPPGAKDFYEDDDELDPATCASSTPCTPSASPTLLAGASTRADDVHAGGQSVSSSSSSAAPSIAFAPFTRSVENVNNVRTQWREGNNKNNNNNPDLADSTRGASSTSCSATSGVKMIGPFMDKKAVSSTSYMDLHPGKKLLEPPTKYLEGDSWEVGTLQDGGETASNVATSKRYPNSQRVEPSSSSNRAQRGSETSSDNPFNYTFTGRLISSAESGQRQQNSRVLPAATERTKTLPLLSENIELMRKQIFEETNIAASDIESEFAHKNHLNFFHSPGSSVFHHHSNHNMQMVELRSNRSGSADLRSNRSNRSGGTEQLCSSAMSISSDTSSLESMMRDIQEMEDADLEDLGDIVNERMQKAVEKIVAVMRGHLDRTQTAQMKSEMVTAANTITAYFRGARERAEVQRVRSAMQTAATKIQAAYKSRAGAAKSLHVEGGAVEIIEIGLGGGAMRTIAEEDDDDGDLDPTPSRMHLPNTGGAFRTPSRGDSRGAVEVRTVKQHGAASPEQNDSCGLPSAVTRDGNNNHGTPAAGSSSSTVLSGTSSLVNQVHHLPVEDEEDEEDAAAGQINNVISAEIERACENISRQVPFVAGADDDARIEIISDETMAAATKIAAFIREVRARNVLSGDAGIHPHFSEAGTLIEGDGDGRGFGTSLMSLAASGHSHFLRSTTSSSHLNFTDDPIMRERELHEVQLETDRVKYEMGKAVKRINDDIRERSQLRKNRAESYLASMKNQKSW
ncbi:unnamed protein product [Amoebophrya sp. A25]|nr:unnamed protein product [Amoebophrya sp. A25]|eukprot:GSA25T00013893001.1